MRFLQGVAVGGEWGGAILMAVEHAPEGKKGFFGSLPQTGVAPGLILSSLAMGAVAALPEADMLSWGWRIPFLASVVLLLVGWFIRAKVAESPDFERMRAQGDKVEVPALVVLRRYPREVLIVVGGRLAEVTWFYTVVTFSLAYSTGTLGIPRATMLDATVWGATLALFTMPLCGVLGDRIGFADLHGRRGRHPVRAHVFSMLQTRDPATVTTAIAVAVGLVYAALYGARRPVLGPVPARGALQRHLAGGAGVGRHRRRTGAAGRHVAAGLRRRRPALHCLVPERAGPGRHRQRVLHAPAHALRAAGRRPPGGPPMKPSHLDYYFWLNSDWPTWAPTAWSARAAPERGHPLQAGRPARRLRAHRRRAAGPALAGTTGLPRRRAAPLVPQAGHPGQPAPAHMCPNADQASRLVIAADLQGLPVAALYKAILHAEWCEDRDISSEPTLREIAAAQGLDADALLRAAPDVERRYRQYTDEAVAAGAFGSPSYVYAGELFWGQDRLEMLEEAIAAA